MNEFGEIFGSLDWSVLTNILLSIIPALLCITVHELCHGLMAYRLGDDTAKNAGRLTLNPIKHIDIIGLAMMAVFHIGWAKPVPVDMRKFKNPKRGMALTAFAGPASNVLLSIIFMFLFGLLLVPLMGFGEAGNVILEMLMYTAQISIFLAIFNIIPIPPMDGSKILFSFLPDDKYYKLMRYERYGMLLLIVLIGITRRTGSPLSSVMNWAVERIYVFAEWGFELGRRLF